MRNLLAVVQVAAATAAVSAVLIDVLPAFAPIPEEPTLLRVRYGVETGIGGSYTSAFTVSDVVYLEEQAEAVEAVSIVNYDFLGILRIGEERYAVQSVAEVMPGYATLYGVELLQGGFFTQVDLDSGADTPVVISDRLARTLFQRVDVVGEKINLRPDNERSLYMGFSGGALDRQSILGSPGLDLQVVGVFRYHDADPFAMTSAPHVLLPLGAQQRARSQQQVSFSATAVTPPGAATGESRPGIPVVETTYLEILVKPKAGMARQAEYEVAALLTELIAERNQNGPVPIYGGPLDEYEVLVSDADQSQQLRQARLLGGLLTGAMGLAALIVAGFTIFTTTMANLTERIRAIGLARALGATRSRVLRDVIAESALLSAIGGAVGVVVAYPFGRYVMQIWQPLTVGASWLTVMSAGLIGILLAVLIGAVGSVFPAWSVAQLLPSEAFREGRG